MEMLLTTYGHTVELAEDGDDAIEKEPRVVTPGPVVDPRWSRYVRYGLTARSRTRRPALRADDSLRRAEQLTVRMRPSLARHLWRHRATARRLHPTNQEILMSMTAMLVILVVVLLLGGGGLYFRR